MHRLHFFLSPLLLALGLLPATIAAAQSGQKPPAEPLNTRPFDAALSGFAQITHIANGNSIRVDTTESLGGLLSFRQNYRPWVGYEVTYGYTHYSDYYNKVYGVKHGTQELSIAYLLQAPATYYGLRPFVTVGGGIIAFSPASGTAGAGYSQSSQVLPSFVYSLGLNRLILSDHIGIRVQYRADKYQTPDYQNQLQNSKTTRTTMEPAIGVYFRF